MLFGHSQSKAIWLFHNQSSKFFVSERKYKNNLKNYESQKKYLQFSYICLFNVLLRNPMVITRF